MCVSVLVQTVQLYLQYDHEQVSGVRSNGHDMIILHGRLQKPACLPACLPASFSSSRLLVQHIICTLCFSHWLDGLVTGMHGPSQAGMEEVRGKEGVCVLRPA